MRGPASDIVFRKEGRGDGDEDGIDAVPADVVEDEGDEDCDCEGLDPRSVVPVDGVDESEEDELDGADLEISGVIGGSGEEHSRKRDHLLTMSRGELMR